MSDGRAWSARCNKSGLKLNVRDIEWKSLMNECLMETKISNTFDNESESNAYENPQSVMDFRHKLVRESTQIFSMPKTQAQTEALKLIRLQNYNRMLKQKEGKLVEKEIVRLKENLENNRLLVREKLNEPAKKRGKSSQKVPKFVQYYSKQCKRLELLDGVCEIDTWLSRSIRMKMTTKINHQGIPVDVKVSLKRRDEAEEALEPPPAPGGSPIFEKTEGVEEICGVNEDKSETMRRFFEGSTESLSEESNDMKEVERMREILELQRKVRLRLMRNSWATWKMYTQQHKTRKKEKKIFKNKIEAFISNLHDRERREEKRKINGSHDMKQINCRLESSTSAKEKEAMNERKEKFLKKLMEEVRISQTETNQKLQEISKANLKIREKSQTPEFLSRIEKRREERLRRRREIQEKKQKSMEEKKNAERLKEEEKKRKEEENERKRLEESREKRRLQAEKRKEQEREREKQQLNAKLAENHYRSHLLRSCGLRPWLKLIEIRDSQEEQAVMFHRRKLLRKAFNGLASNAREETRLKVAIADEFYARTLKKNYLFFWIDFHEENMKRDQVAADWNDFKITERAFRKWLLFTQNEQMEYLNKKAVAMLSYERSLKLKYLKKLKDYPQFKKLEQAKENRKRKWRQRVKEILPDYQPVETCPV